MLTSNGTQQSMVPIVLGGPSVCSPPINVANTTIDYQHIADNIPNISVATKVRFDYYANMVGTVLK